MSDVMFYGVLRMPYEMAMGDEMSRRQFYARAQEAADRVEKAEAAALSQPAAAWQPIETAPKDGSSVILSEDDDCVGQGFWSDGKGFHENREVGWFWMFDLSSILIASNARPTHWMPFPAAPKATA